MSVMALLGLGFVAIFLLMTVVWIVQLRTRNAGIVDALWALSFPILACLYLFPSHAAGIRQLVLLALVAGWGLRLGVHLFIRNFQGEEDARYASLRKSWGPKANRNMFLFFQLQTLLAVVLSLPYAFVAIDEQKGLSTLNVLGTLIGLTALIGESVSDYQLKTFKKDSANKGKVLRTGLWKYSRHPNYFFEWLMWVAFSVYALSSPWGWISFTGIILMYHFLLNVTGIPATEEHMLKSKGEAYRIYQQQTPAFFPGVKTKK